MLCKLWS